MMQAAERTNMNFPFTQTWLEDGIAHLRWLLENEVEVAGFYAPELLRDMKVAQMELAGEDITNEQAED